MARFYEQRIITTGEVVDRFFSHGKDQSQVCHANSYFHHVPSSDYKRLWSEEGFEDMEVGTMKRFSGQTILVRIA